MARPDDPEAWALALGISREAVELYLACEVIDLHLDSFLWSRLFGYDLRKRHGSGLLGGRFYSSADFPRARTSLSGATWVITTQPWRTALGRQRTFFQNLATLSGLLDAEPGVQRVGTVEQYREARAQGQHAAFIGVQGGNALDCDLGDLARLGERDLLRVTLLHGSRSSLGVPSTHGAQAGGLTARGRNMVEALNARRIFVDLAHIAPSGFWDAVEVHDPTLPLLVSHTGVSGVHPCWRNVDDRQLRTVAESGGVVGVIFHSYYLGDPLFWGGRAERVVDHIEHIVNVAGPDVPALGSDFDGFIIPPRDLTSVEHLPRLVERMLRRGMTEDLIRKVMGENFLAALGRLRSCSSESLPDRS